MSDKNACFESVYELSHGGPVKCMHDKGMRRPRCGHMLTNKCHLLTALSSAWDSSYVGRGVDFPANVDQKLVVPYRHGYGRSENELIPELPACQVKVGYRAKCGHNFPTEMLCVQAFNHALSNEKELVCMTSTDTACFLCRSTQLSKIPCWSVAESNRLRVLFDLVAAESDAVDGAFQVKEDSVKRFTQQAAVPSNILNVWRRRCVTKCRLNRPCGHTIGLACCDLLDAFTTVGYQFPACEENVKRTLACGHVVVVKCCARAELPEPK